MVVEIGGLKIDAITEAEVIAHVLGELQAGRGGRLAALNVDVFRGASRDADLRRLLSESTLLVPDGMPVVWAARLRGTPVPERVTGASLILTLSRAAALAGRSIYLLGGPPGVPQQAGAEMRRRYPGLIVAGADAPPFGFDSTPAGIDAVCERLAGAAPDIVFVGLGFPKQERLIARLAPAIPSSWFVGCGAAISFAADTSLRAPPWMQQAGLEWMFRLRNEPRRLAERYLVNDLPFAAQLLTSSLAYRAGWSGAISPSSGLTSAMRHRRRGVATAQQTSQVVRGDVLATAAAPLDGLASPATEPSAGIVTGVVSDELMSVSGSQTTISSST